MSFLAPLALLGAAIIGPIIVAMYLLKLRREERPVGSTFLWQRMVRDVEANAPWQRLRRNVLLFLQLLLLLLLVLALARPFFQTTGISGRNLIVIIDRSASMAAADAGGSSRLEAARQQAMTLIDQLPDGGRATIIAAGGQMEVPAASSADRRELRAAIRGIQLRTGGGSDLSQALTLAAALAAREPDSEVSIISDGNVLIPPELVVPATVRYFPVGARGDNMAVSQLALQPAPGGQTLFAQATNYGDQPATRRLNLYLDGSLFNSYDVTIGPGAEQSVIEQIPAQVQTVQACLRNLDAPPIQGLAACDSGHDTLALDDRAAAVSSLGESTRVLVYSPGNRFLELGLALLPRIETSYARTVTETLDPAQPPPAITIFDGMIPEQLPPGNLMFIRPLRSTEFFSVTGELEFPALRPVAGDEPLLHNVGLSEVSVLRAARVTAGTWAQVIVDSDGAPLLLAGETAGRRVVVLAFDLRDSDLPLNVAWPLLLSNLVNYLAPGSGAEAAQVVPGQPLALTVDETITEVRVTRPDGRTEPAVVQAGLAVYAETDQLGVYQVEERRGTEVVAVHRYAVNLFNANESRLAPQPSLAVAQASGRQDAVTRERVGRNEIWRWLAAAALLVLVIEWLVYQRNGLVYLRERVRRRQPAGVSR